MKIDNILSYLVIVIVTRSVQGVTINNVFIKSVDEVVDLGLKISASRLIAPSMESAISKSMLAAINARLH